MAEPAPLKACANCNHCVSDDSYFFYCDHPDYRFKTKDYIRGVTHANRRMCVLVREDENLCGDSARGWEEKLPQEPGHHASLWSAFKGMLKELFGIFLGDAPGANSKEGH